MEDTTHGYGPTPEELAREREHAARTSKARENFENDLRRDIARLDSHLSSILFRLLDGPPDPGPPQDAIADAGE